MFFVTAQFPEKWLQMRYGLLQGHPTTVFGKIFVRGSKYCLEVSIALERLKSSRCLFHLCKIFGVFLLTSLQFSKVGIFTFHFPDLVNKGPLKLSVSQKSHGKGIKKSQVFINLGTASKFFGKMIGKP